MTVLLREDDVRRVLTMPDAIAALDIAFRAWGSGAATNISRQRVQMRESQGTLNVLPASVPELDALGFKAYTAFPGGMRFAVQLYSATTGELQAIIEADWMGRMRTGAASGLATHYLARPDATIVGMLGTGSQAVTQLMAVAAARPIALARVWGRDPERLDDFCATMTEQLRFAVEPVDSPEDAIRDSDIIITITSAREPILHGGWIRPGTHINAAGSNWHNRRELDDEVITRADLIVADSVDQAHYEAGDLIIPASQGKLLWNRVRELNAVITGRTPGRLSDRAVTIFKSLGIGLEDVAVASRVYTLACEQGLGEEIDFLP